MIALRGRIKRTVIKPTAFSSNVWIDAEDYPIGTFANGATITNKANGAITFTVVGTTLAIQYNAQNKKEFVFDGTSWIRCTSANSGFTKYKDGTISYSVLFIGKIGTTSNPDAIYGICGNSAVTSAAHGFFICADNRTVTPVADRGYRHGISKNSAGNFPINSIYNNTTFNSKKSLYFTLDVGVTSDPHRLFIDSNLGGVTDRTRTSANTQAGLGAVITYASNDPTHAFDIGTAGNGGSPFIGKMEQFIIFDTKLSIVQVRGVDEYFQTRPASIGDSNFQSVSVLQTVSNTDYIFGGTYAKNAGKTKTVFVTSTGAAHNNADLRVGVQLVATNNIVNFPTSYTTVFSENNVHLGPSGGYAPSGRLVIAYGKFTITTGEWNSMIVRYSDDDGTTWSSEITLTVPTTSPALTAMVAHDKLVVCNNGDIAIPIYAFSTTALYKIYLIRSTDNGATWSFTEVYSSGSAYINESSFCHLGGNDWLVMSRVEVAVGGFYEYRQFKSTDDLATFTDQSDTNFDLNYVAAHPPMIRSVMIDGTRVVELSWVNRGTRRWHMKYALPSDLLTNGASAWNSKTLYTMDVGQQGHTSTGWISGYPFVIHPNNDLKWEGVWFEDNNADTDLHVIRLSDLHKSKIKTELGI